MSTSPTPIKDVLADDTHPLHAKTKAMMADLVTGAVSICACLGPQYDEPYCVCEMRSRGLALNEPAREADIAAFVAGMDAMEETNTDGE